MSQMDQGPCKICNGPTLMRSIRGHSWNCQNLMMEQIERDREDVRRGECHRFIGAPVPSIVVCL